MDERKGTVSWMHFGDLHLRERDDENFLDFLELIDEANENLAGHIDFAFLPGDNADDGTDAQYGLVREGLKRLKLPVHILTGDHDRKAGTLDSLQRHLEPELYRSVTLRNFHLIFLNAMDGSDHKAFDLGEEQMEWLKAELGRAIDSRLRPIVFVHLYPSEMVTKGQEFSRLIRTHGVEVVEMGHTHYNELANDGRTVYAATRSTGQIEEGPPGFSLTVIDEDVISWKFKQRGTWPFVMITSPADHRLITDLDRQRQVVRGPSSVRARAWDGRGIASVTCSIDDSAPREMQRVEDGYWELHWNASELSDGSHGLRVEAKTSDGDSAEDEITILLGESGLSALPSRHVVDYENALGPWPQKGILGTQLGPNENGIKGPWPSWRGRPC